MSTPSHGATVFDAAQGFLKDRTKLSTISARWMPVHLEPITFSGERITIAVAIAPEDGTQAKVVSTLAIEPLEQVFGQYGRHLFNLAGVVVADLQAFLATGGSLHNWQPNMQGVYAGNIVPTRNTTLDAIIQSALTHSSLFSAKTNDSSDEEQADRSLGRFQAEIKRLVTVSRAGYSERFNRPMELFGSRGRATISYVGTNLAINLSTLDPSGNATYYQCATAQRKITNLMRLRDINIGHDHEELLLGIWVPHRELSAAQEGNLDAYTTELAYAAKKAEVGIEVVYGDTNLIESASVFAKKILADA